jgi:hypothetical protein
MGERADIAQLRISRQGKFFPEEFLMAPDPQPDVRCLISSFLLLTSYFLLSVGIAPPSVNSALDVGR